MVKRYSVLTNSRRSVTVEAGIIVVRNRTEVNVVDPIPFTDGDTTPSVAAGFKFVTANTAATSITGFDGTKGDGHMITVLAGDDDTTLVHSSILMLESEDDETLSEGDIRQLLSYGGVWYVWTGRSV